MKQISEFLIGETSKALYNSENAILNAYITYTQKYAFKYSILIILRGIIFVCFEIWTLMF